MSNVTAVDRVKMELRDFARDGDDTFKLELCGDDWTQLRGMLIGPIDTPYEGGKFFVDINIPEHYPFQPPNVRFITKLWHPNISSVTGVICLDVLKDEWSAVLTLRTMLLSLQSLLSDPQPNDPQDAVVARQVINNPTIYKLTARHWTNVYADGPTGISQYDTVIRKFIVLGFEEHKARVALSSNDWDTFKAVDDLTS